MAVQYETTSQIFTGLFGPEDRITEFSLEKDKKLILQSPFLWTVQIINKRSVQLLN